MNDEARKVTVFLDTNVLLKAFVEYRKRQQLPVYMSDPVANRFTFEKCIFEAYMAFRGVGGKKPSEGRGDWAQRYLKTEDDPSQMSRLASEFHEGSTALAFFWANQILEIEPDDYAEIISRYLSPDEQEKATESLGKFQTLRKQRQLFEELCSDFIEMLQDTKVTILSYANVFGSPDRWLKGVPSFFSLKTLDSFAKDTVLPSEDFEIVYAAIRVLADIFVTDDNHLRKCAMSLGLDPPLSAAGFCSSQEYEAKVREWKAGVMLASF
jgi:hypothetical protein